MVPSGNFIDNDPGLTLSGKKPYPYYAPRLETSFVVDKGVDVGLPFKGAAPDIGAYEFGDETWIYREKSKSMPHPVQIRLRVDPAIKRLYVLSIGREQNMRAFVRILNTQGRIIETAALPESGTGAVDLSGLASGAYIAEVVANGNSIGNHPFAHR